MAASGVVAVQPAEQVEAGVTFVGPEAAPAQSRYTALNAGVLTAAVQKLLGGCPRLDDTLAA
ncbi:hypothetical protein GCM10010207_61130 [Streptomyces atratus]|nr:hypothetical protein GCM10010207_61130 [Streptomyces atratus]